MNRHNWVNRSAEIEWSQTDTGVTIKTLPTASDFPAGMLLKTVRVVEIDLGDDQRKQSVTHGSARAAHILKAIGITDLDPHSAATDPKKAA